MRVTNGQRRLGLPVGNSPLPNTRILAEPKSTPNSGQTARIRVDAHLGHRMDEMRTDIREIGTRLRGVEVALGQVDQRLLTLERTIIPTAPPAQ